MGKTTFRYGAVYRIERHYTREELVQNLAMMKEYGMDTVVIWPAVFWWEKKTDRYPFDTGLFLLDEAEKLGMKVIMELAGQIPCLEYAPDFDFQEEFYCLNEDGTRRKQACWYDPVNYNHPVLKQKIEEIYRKTARAYRNHPALYRYDIWNEAVFRSYDPWTLQLFQKYLKEKYQTIDRLNDNWERTYRDFDQIDFTSWMWSSIKPQTDYYEFSKHNVGMVLAEWKSYIKDEDPLHPVVADNIGCMVNSEWAFDRPQDDREVSRIADEYGISFYPKQCEADEFHHADRHITLAATRAAADGDFWISEMQGHIQALFRPSTAVKPYELKRWCFESIGHGAKGIIYWKWDPFFKGLQTYGRGLVDFEGRPTPRLEAAAAVIREIQPLQKEILASRSAPARAGVLFDGRNHNFVKALCKNYGTPPIYTNQVCAAYQAFFSAGVQTDIVYPESNWDGLKLLVVCNQVVMDNELCEKISRFAQSGGVVLFSGMTGMMDESSVMFRKIPGGEYREMFGCRQVDTEYRSGSVFSCFGAQIPCEEYRNLLEPLCDGKASPEVLARYEDGLPAAIRTPWGEGSIILFAGEVFSEETSALALAKGLDDAYRLSLVQTEGEVTVHLAEYEGGLLAFLFNYTDQKQAFRVQAGGLSCKGELAANDSAVVRLSAQEEGR